MFLHSLKKYTVLYAFCITILTISFLSACPIPTNNGDSGTGGGSPGTGGGSPGTGGGSPGAEGGSPGAEGGNQRTGGEIIPAITKINVQMNAFAGNGIAGYQDATTGANARFFPYRNNSRFQ